MISSAIEKGEVAAKVFVSYNREDRHWRDQFMKHIRPLERKGVVVCWVDSQISKGGKWQQELDEAIQEAQIAVLLVSADYIKSDFIQKQELPKLLAAFENRRLALLPVILTPCRWDLTTLKEFQAVNLPEHPLAGLAPAEQDAQWVEVTKEIEKILGLSDRVLGNDPVIVEHRWRCNRVRFVPRWAALVFLSGLAVLVGGLVWWVIQRPGIDEVIPITPVIEGRLEILGGNFPADRDQVEVLFDDVRAQLLEAPTVDRLVVRVPREATSGPLRVVRKLTRLPFLPGPEARVVIPTINRLQQDVSLLSEAVKTSDKEFAVRFSILNLTTDRRIKVNEIQLHMIVLVDRQSPTFRRRRVDLGSFSVLSGNAEARRLTYPVTTLLPEDSVFELPPHDSEALSFTILRPKSAHKLQMMFAISASYFDDRGQRGKVLGDRIFNLRVDHLEGFAWLEDKALDTATLEELADEYQESFHGVTGLRDREESK